MLHDAAGTAHDELIEFRQKACCRREADMLGRAQVGAVIHRRDQKAFARTRVDHDVLVVDVIPAVDAVMLDALDRSALFIAEFVELGRQL